MGVPTGIYLRISDDPEGRELGVKRQEDDCRALCKREGDEVIEVYKDNDLSASTKAKKERPAYQRMLADAASGRIRKIVAYTTARITRKPRENEDLIELAEKHGTIFRYVNSPSFDLNTADGRQMARMLAAQDAAEAERTSERARRAKLQAATDGLWRGGRRPFGYDSDGMTVRESEAKIVKQCCDLLLAGATLGGMARDLTERGVPTALGGTTWRPDSLRAILMRARNAGIVERQGEEIGKAVWKPIVDEDVWRAVRALLSDPSRKMRHSTERVYLGSGIYRCGVCDDGTTVRSTMTKGGTEHPYRRGYLCRKKAHLVRVAAPVDNLVERTAVAFLTDPKNVARLLAKSDTVDTAALHREANLIKARLDELDDELDDRLITKDRWARRNARLTKRLNEVRAKLTAVTTGSVLDGLPGNPDLPRMWYGEREDRSDGFSVSRRAAIVDAVMVVTLLPAPRGRRPNGTYFDPSCVHIEPR